MTEHVTTDGKWRSVSLDNSFTYRGFRYRLMDFVHAEAPLNLDWDLQFTITNKMAVVVRYHESMVHLVKVGLVTWD